MPNIDLSILNQRQTPAFYADVFANRPAAGFIGRIFVSTNTFAFYRDNGTGWDLIGGPGTGTITGSGTAGTVPLWNGASTIGDSSILEGSTKITTTKDFQADGYYLTGMTAGSGALYYTSDRVTLANYNPTGTVVIEVAGGANAQLIAADLSTTFYGNIIRNGGTSSQFLKADGSLDSSAYVTTNIYNGNGTLSGERTVSLNGNNLIFDGGASIARVRMDADTNVARIFSFATNNLPRWAFRIDGTESGSDAGSDFAIRRYNDAGTFVDAPLTVTRSTGQSTFAKKVVIENNAGDQQLQIVSTTAPSLRLDNLQTGATKRAGLGISTATNNFIQGSADRDFCIFNGSTAAASPILFGIYDATAVNVQEAARISSARNFIVGSTIDAGYKFDTNGTARITGNTILESKALISTNDATKTPLLLNSNGNYSVSGNMTNGFAITNGSFGRAFNMGVFDAGPYAWLQAAYINNADVTFNLVIQPRGGNVSIGSTNASYKLTVREVTTSFVGYFGESQTSAASNGLLALQSGRIPQSGGDTSGVSGVNFLHSYGTGGVNGDANGGYIRSVRESVFGTTSQVNTSLNFATTSANVDAEVARFTSSKNFLINGTIDNGNRLQVFGNTYTEGVYIATGQFSQGGSATSTFYTFSNISSNRMFLITLRQSGSSANNVVAVGFVYAGVLAAYNVVQDNTNPALFLTITSTGGLGLQLTTGAGYGTTTWEYTITQIK